MWKCSKCGAECEDELCPVCGAAKDEAAEEVAAEEAAAEEVAAEEVAAEEVAAEEVVTEEVEAEEVVTEEAADAVDLSAPLDETEIPTKWICPVCSQECDGEECPTCGEPRGEGINIVDFGGGKKNKKKIALITIIAAVVVLVAGIFTYFFINRNLKGTGENGNVTYSDIMDTTDSIFGDDVVLKINGIEVPVDAFENYLTSNALNYQVEYCYSDTGAADTSVLESFKWTDIADKKSGKTHREIVIEDTVNDCIEIYSILSMGEEYNIKASQSDLDEVDAQIEEYEEQYGDNFEKILELNGYNSVDQYRSILEINAQINAVVTDLEEHPDRYINEDHSVYDMEDLEVITAKHILIMIDEENGVDEAAAKKTAEKVLAKIKKGSDFDKLLKEYNDDENEPSEGYTFGKGQMMQEFEDAAFALAPDEISPLVKTDYGYHIIKREVGYMDVITYAKRSAKVNVNKSLIKDFEIKADYLNLQKEAESMADGE